MWCFGCKYRYFYGIITFFERKIVYLHPIFVMDNLFYPSHDIALANGVKHFNPPAAALNLQLDLASLTEIWNLPYLEGKELIPTPWGWDWDTRAMIHKGFGIKMSQLPTDEDLQRIRQLSSRQTTIYLTNALRQRLAAEAEMLCFTNPQYLDSEASVDAFITRCDDASTPFVMKTPWSSSGRGLSVSQSVCEDGSIRQQPRELIKRHALGTIRKMGGIMGEEWTQGKQQDFAMLFHASSSEVRHIGFSLFDNDTSTGGTTYRQGYLLSNEAIIERLRVAPSLPQKIAEAYVGILQEMLSPLMGKPWALGYLGIDMLTCKEGEEKGKNVGQEVGKTLLRINPCIELNLRCTMGVVCRLWHDQHQLDGTFRISSMLENGHFRAEFLATR